LDSLVDSTHLERTGYQFQEKVIKYLGMFVDESLSWKYHFDLREKQDVTAFIWHKAGKEFLIKR